MADLDKGTLDGAKGRKVGPVWERFSTALKGGHFEALVCLQEGYTPDYMKITGPFSPGVLRAELPADALTRLEHDEKVISVDVREFVSP